MSFIKNLKKYIKKPWVIVGLVLLVVIIYFSSRSSSSIASTDIIAVKQGTVSEEVSVTGKVKSADQVNLSFEKSGKVAKVLKSVGDRVSAGDLIVELDKSDANATLAQARANLKIQQAKLDELVSGTRQGSLDISQNKADTAKADLENARRSFLNSLQGTYTLVDDAIYNKVDQYIVNPRGGNAQIAFAVTITPVTSLETGRNKVEDSLDIIRKALAVATTTDDLFALSAKIKQNLGEIKLFVENMSLAVNNLNNSSYLSATTVATWKADTSIARTNVNTAITNTLNAENTYRAAQSASSVAQNELTIDTLGRGIETQQAQVDQAQAGVSSAYSGVTKMSIVSPINGILAKQEAKIGENIVPNTNIVTVLSDAQFEIEAFVPEADLAKVMNGASADVTLDAYGSDVLFTAKVTAIDPAETMIDGVPTYKTIFQFDTLDERIRSGMTANVDVRGQVKEGVLYIPQRAIVSKNGTKYVNLKTGSNTTKQVEIKTGLRGSTGTVEITEGLKLGDEVVLNVK